MNNLKLYHIDFHVSFSTCYVNTTSCGRHNIITYSCSTASILYYLYINIYRQVEREKLKLELDVMMVCGAIT